MKREWKGKTGPINTEIPVDLHREVAGFVKKRGMTIKEAATQAFSMWLDWAEKGGDPRPPIENMTEEEQAVMRMMLIYLRKGKDRDRFVKWLRMWVEE